MSGNRSAGFERGLCFSRPHCAFDRSASDSPSAPTRRPHGYPAPCACGYSYSHMWFRGPWPRPSRKSCAMAPVMYVFAAPTASTTSSPRARPHAIAEESVQPVPCVFSVITRFAVNHRSWPSAATSRSRACSEDESASDAALSAPSATPPRAESCATLRPKPL